ncbi:hypothetical protein [uncultured Gimesia sp.]|uniref:hypothetical protein n=1 Tax=uncultured Gimesia sp. TaxID=1678688 RepID=UPI002608E025|nr:hypothetical protein [uncultured Gimesia sp.]
MTAISGELVPKATTVKPINRGDTPQMVDSTGAKIFVCGQSLIGKGGKPEDVVVFL